MIATSLPAIAADIGTNPLALKLALTSYLLSLAVFIPMSGWTADRFGARTVFTSAPRCVHARLDRLRAGILARRFRDRPHRPGHGRRHDDAGRPARAGALDRQARTRQCHGLGDGARPCRPGDRPAGRRLHHDLCVVALDLPDQYPDRAHWHCVCTQIHRSGARGRSRAVRRQRHAARKPWRCGLGFRAVGRGPRSFALVGGRRIDRRRRGGDDALRFPCAQGESPAARFLG